MVVYGIDLGTTYSAIAKLDRNDLPLMIENFDDASELIASAVYFPEGGEPIVGETAKKYYVTETDRVVQFAKREIRKGTDKTWSIDGKTYDPVMISTEILKQIKKYAEAQGEAVENVVITCPACFTQKMRGYVREAGKNAGFNVLDVVNEPTAAALNYCIREYQENRKILVYDLGGGTFDVTLLDFSVIEAGVRAKIKVIATEGAAELGGINWDNELKNLMMSKYAEKAGLGSPDSIEPLVEKNIRSAAEATKIALSKKPEKEVVIINASGVPETIKVTQAEF